MHSDTTEKRSLRASLVRASSGEVRLELELREKDFRLIRKSKPLTHCVQVLDQLWVAVLGPRDQMNAANWKPWPVKLRCLGL